MARLQFRHLSTVKNNRDDAKQYLNNLVDSGRINSIGESLIGEPLVVPYYDENGNKQIILAIGVSGESGDAILEPYHIIDSAKYDEDIQELSAVTEEIKENTIRSIEINTREPWIGTGHGTSGTVENNLAYITLTTDNVIIPHNEESEGQFIHHDHSVTDFIKSVEGLHLELVTTGLEANVKEKYDLMDGDGHKLGNTSIKIYKDSAYKEIYLGTSADTVDTTTGVVTKLEGDKESLNYVYMKADGTYEMIKVDLEQFLTESEFGNGLQVDGHLVSVKIDNASENFLTVSENGVKVAGVQDAIDAAKDAEQARAEGVEQTLQNQLNDEIANRESADSALSDRIDSLEGETLSGEGAILVEGDSDKVVSLRINSADKVLTQDNSGLLTNLTVGIAEEDDVTYIVLKGKNDTEISRVNANKFVTDGMIDRVEIVGNQLVIEWNTQAGKQTVYIPLSDIFNPENYYTKEDIDNGLNNYIFNHINAAEGNPEEAEHNLLKWYEDPNTGKKMYYASNNTADMVCWASGKTLDTILQELQNGSGSSGTDEYARQQIANEIVKRQNDDNAISAKTNEEIQRLEDKINALSGLTPSEIDEINQRLDEIESGLTNFYTKEEIDDMSEVISASLNDLNDRKANKSDVYTKEEVDDIISHIDISGSTERIKEELNELSASTISEINKIENEINDLSGATESAISEINEKIDDLSGATQVIENKVNDLSGATASEIDRLEGKIDVLSAATQGIESNLNELSAATESAISEINDNISELSGATQIIENNLNDLSGATQVIERNLSELSAATMGTFNGAEYVSSAKTIVFKHDNEVIDTIDATDFIKDGMVDNVLISGGSLVITFNLDAGKEDIEIPLEDLFDPSNYYNKTEIDNKVSEIESALSAETADRTAEDERLDEKIDTESERAITEETAIWSALTQEITERTSNDDEINEKLEEDEKVIAAALNDLNDRVEGIEDKVKGDIYTKEEIDELIADIDVSDQLDGLRQELNTSINNERSERQSADNAINNKLYQLSANTEYYVTYDFFNPKEEVVAAAINDLNDRIGELEESVTGSVYTKEEADNKFLTKEDWENDEFVISTSLNDLNSRIIELSGNSGQVDLSGYYTSGQTDAAIATAVETATANLVTSGDVAENFYTKDEIDNDGKVISAAMNDLNDRKANKTDVYTKDEVNALIPQNTVRSSSVGFIWSGSQADFNAITEKDSNTLYIITGTTS